MPRKARKKPVRVDWHQNHHRLVTAFVAFVRQNGRRPTNEWLAKQTKLSMGTVKRHLQHMRFEPTKHPARLMTDTVIVGLGERAATGDPQAAKLWFQVMEGWSEKTAEKPPTEIPTLRIEMYDDRAPEPPRGDDDAAAE